ncbi:ATP-binding protein [Pannonibacter carbonis]|uniref:ATP-binding protein n=1 Tax=Pannonibacter carbonis TaxID=2067569 RepID=UPI000D0F0954|nr:ATP-binding protein [Pannonibacter carbonis]
MDQNLTTFLALSAHADLAPLIAADRPAWLWAAGGDRVLWANAAGAAFFDAASPQALASLSGLDRAQARPHLARIATTGPTDRPSLERLRFYKGLKVVLFTCQCRRLVLGTGETAALIIAADGPIRTARPEADFLALVAAGASGMTLALADAEGALVAREGDDAAALPHRIAPEEDMVLLAGTAHHLIRLPLGADYCLMLVDGEPADDDSNDDPAQVALPGVTSDAPAAVAPAPKPKDNVKTDTIILAEPAAEQPVTEGPDLQTSAPADAVDTAVPVDAATVAVPIAALPEDTIPAASLPEPVAAALGDMPESPVDMGEAGSFAQRGRPVRFAWKMDVDQRFTFLSPEFADVLGSKAADIVGSTWTEVADRFGLDPRGTIAKALSRRDTWSGKTVDWPVPGSGVRIPVDMAALPAFDRRRVFEGYRGFGVLRPSDATEDADLLTGAPSDAPMTDILARDAETAPLDTLTVSPATSPSDPISDAGVSLAEKSAVTAAAVVADPETTLSPVTLLPEETVPADLSAVTDLPEPADTTQRSNGFPALGEIAAGVADERAAPSPVAAAEIDAAADARLDVSGPEAAAAQPPSQQASLPDDQDTSAPTAADALPATVASEVDDLRASSTLKQSGSTDLFDTTAREGTADLVGIAGDKPLPPKEIEKAVRTLAREFDAALERRAARQAADSAPARTYRQPTTETVTSSSSAGLDAVAPAVPQEPPSASSMPELPAPAVSGPTPAEAFVSALVADETKPELSQPADASFVEVLAAAGSSTSATTEPQQEAELPAPASMLAEDAEPATADDAFIPEPAPVTTAEADTATGSGIEPHDGSGATETTSGDPHGEASTERQAPRATGDTPANPADAQPEPAAGPDRVDNRVVPFTAPGGTRLPRMVPVDTSRLSKPERAAFRKIAEALGARLEGDFEEEEEEETQADVPAAAPAAADATPQRPVAPPAEPIDPRLLDRLPIGIGIVRDREVLYANETLLSLLGYPHIEALEEAGGFEAIFVDPEHMPGDRLEGTVDEAMLLRRANGRLSPVDARMHTVPWNGGRGLMVSIVERPVAAQPAAPQPAANTADMELGLSLAREQISEMDTILETATDGVLLLDRFGTILKANGSAEALFGAARSDLVGAPLTEFLAQESHRSAMDYLDGLARNGVASVLNDGREVIGQVSSGGLIPLFMTIGRLGSGEGLKFCAVLRDITQWKAAEEELTKAKRQAENASSQKSDFLAKISHEIRTPLNAIIGFSEVMIEERFGAIGNERYKEYLKDIRTSGSHIMSLINDLLDLSKIEAGKMDLTFEAVSANDIVRECVALMQPQANRERVIIRASLPGTVPNVVADLRSLRQIVLNLLSNAIKFNKSGGQVIVSTALEPSGEVVLRVRDTGTGMNSKDLAAALEPFRQVHTARHGGGTGLGLPLTKALVEANRAGFKIDSVPDQGTLVEITFPPQRVLAE